VKRGWALNQDEESEGLYAPDQDEAHFKRHGIWTSRFQTPEDWRDGVQRFVDHGEKTGQDPTGDEKPDIPED
ncbi:MAG: hypothetical protein PHY92_10545, partial [Alphaproteobacteria bacterium]|nr:hypothetical protein [Alphaproteobacteria bacterium]